MKMFVRHREAGSEKSLKKLKTMATAYRMNVEYQR